MSTVQYDFCPYEKGKFDTEKFINRWMETEVVIHRYNRILLSYKEELIWVSPKEMGEPTAYCTEWSEAGRERQILYINLCVWNLERWHRWTYFQGKQMATLMDQMVKNPPTIWV